MSESAALDAVATKGTLEAWLELDTPQTAGYQTVLTSSTITTPDGFSWATQPVAPAAGHYFYPWAGKVSSDGNIIPNPFTLSTWHYVVIALDNGNHNVSRCSSTARRSPSTTGVTTANWS